MTLRTVMAAVAEVGGESPLIAQWWPSPQATVDASHCPALMPLPGGGSSSPGDVTATMRPQVHRVRLWLLVAPDSQDYGTAMDDLTDLVSSVIDRITLGWARTPRHPAFVRTVRRIDEITYSTESGLIVGGTTFYGGEIIVAVQEETRVQ